MKIQQTKVNFVRLPLEEPLVGAPYMPGMLREFFTVQVQTDEGIEGIGITGFGGKLTRALGAAIEDLGGLIKGDDPLRVEQVNAKMRAASAPCGSGIAMLAISALDTALWDIRGKAFGLPLAHLLGGLRDKVPAYMPVRCADAHHADEQTRARRIRPRREGLYRQMKTSRWRWRGLNPAQEIERIKLVREAVGPEVNLMVDINQRWSVARSDLRIAHRDRRPHALDGWRTPRTNATITRATPRSPMQLAMPICAGEYLWGIEPHRQALSHHSSRHHHDRSAAGRRRDPMDAEGGWHGGSLQQARRQPPAAGEFMST